MEILRYVENGPSKLSQVVRFLLHAEFAYYIPPEIALPTAEEETADALTGGYRRSDTKALQAARRTYMAKNESDKSPCFAFIMKTILEKFIECMTKLDHIDDQIKDSCDSAVQLRRHRDCTQYKDLYLTGTNES